jgi:hypothetical protein
VGEEFHISGFWFAHILWNLFLFSPQKTYTLKKELSVGRELKSRQKGDPNPGTSRDLCIICHS